MKFISGISVLFGIIISRVRCESCVEPKITSKTYTTQDATVVTNIAYITEFNVECGIGVITNLYADIDGNVQPLSLIGPNSYQVCAYIFFFLVSLLTTSGYFRSAGRRRSLRPAAVKE